MRKIGKLNQFLSLLVLSLCSFSLLYGQDTEVTATLSQTNIYSGERVLLKISVAGSSLSSINQPSLPAIEGMRWLRGTTQRGTNINYQNGKRIITSSFGYVLIAQQPGDYTVPPIEVSANDQTYTTEPIKFTILDPDDISEKEKSQSADIYVRLEPSKSTPVVGEQVIVDIILYFKDGIDVSSYRATPGWKAEGFWKEELQNPQRAHTSSRIINNIRYQRAHLLQYALFPTKSGELTLSPFEITTSVRQQSRNNSLFNLNLNQEQIPLKTEPVTLKVRPLPELKDATLMGAVGNFEISRSISSSNAFVGESIEITTRINGTGNIPLITKPEYKYPEGLERYNPQENSSISRLNREISGFKSYTDIIIARNEGTYIIPEEKVAYYNPNTDRYVTEVLPEITFTAKRNPDATSTVNNALRLDVEPITGLAQWVTPQEAPLHHKTWVWVLLMTPLLTTAVAFAYKNYHDRLNSDTAFARSQKAKTKAYEILAQGEETSDIKTGYHLIEKALIQFITDKLNLPPAGLSSQHIISEVSEIASAEITQELKRLFSKCETIAYAPNTTQAGLQNDIQKTKELLNTIGKLV
ncbi:MAG: protein BatD [Balneolaceae bacterium]|nr:protein BatD [Balneolaceae bacterium]